MEGNQSNKLSIPAAIVLAGALIAVAVYASLNSSPATPKAQPSPIVANIKSTPVTSEDYIKGNPNAPIVIVEYSDKECPFCKRFHTTMLSVMNQYGKDGTVAWVYRHFPIAGNHKQAFTEHEASECVNELAGPVAFWKFIDKVYEATPSNDGLDLALLPVFAAEAGADKTAFNTCLASGKYTSKIQQAVTDAMNVGAQGTPYSIMLFKKAISQAHVDAITKYVIDQNLFDMEGNPYIHVSSDKLKISLNGALPIEVMTALIEIVK